MTAIVERCVRGVLPADTAQTFFFLRILPVRNTFAKFPIVLPTTNKGVASRSFDKGAGPVLLVVDPVPVVRVAVLERVETVAVALAELKGAFVGSTAVVEHFPVTVTVAVLDLAFIVFRGEVVICEMAIKL